MIYHVKDHKIFHKTQSIFLYKFMNHHIKIYSIYGKYHNKNNCNRKHFNRNNYYKNYDDIKNFRINHNKAPIFMQGYKKT